MTWMARCGTETLREFEGHLPVHPAVLASPGKGESTEINQRKGPQNAKVQGFQELIYQNLLIRFVSKSRHMLSNTNPKLEKTAVGFCCVFFENRWRNDHRNLYEF